MPDEPEHDIEKRLKAYAKQRRDEAGAPRPLHPATRKMLRDEALRAHSRARRDVGFWRTLWISRQRFAVAGGVIAVLAIAAWIMLPGSPKKRAEMNLALNRSVPAVRQLSAPGAAPPAATPPAMPEVALADRDQEVHASSSKFEQPVNKPESARKTGMNGVTTTPMLGDKVTLAYKETLTTDSLAVAKKMPANRLQAGMATNAIALADAPLRPTYDNPGVAPALPVQVGGGGGGFGGAAPAGAVTEKYARVDGAVNAGTVLRKINELPVLSSFRLEQTNGQVRVIDADGSVYAGFVLQTVAVQGTPPAFAAKDFRSSATPQAADAGMASGSVPSGVPVGAVLDTSAGVRTRNISFRVAGTNRSLNQSVLFTGTLQPAEASPAASLPIAGTGGKLGDTQRLRRAPASPSRVMGRVVIGGTNEQDVNAEATRP